MNAILSMIGRVIGLIATIVLVVGIGVMVNLERLIMVDQPVEKAAYAVALDGDNRRVMLAADLVKRGLADRVLLSNGEPVHEDEMTSLMREIGYAPPDRMEVKYRMLEKLGVARDKIAEFGLASLNTREEAKALLDAGKTPAEAKDSVEHVIDRLRSNTRIQRFVGKYLSAQLEKAWKEMGGAAFPAD